MLYPRWDNGDGWRVLQPMSHQRGRLKYDGTATPGRVEMPHHLPCAGDDAMGRRTKHARPIAVRPNVAVMPMRIGMKASIADSSLVGFVDRTRHCVHLALQAVAEAWHIFYDAKNLGPRPCTRKRCVLKVVTSAHVPSRGALGACHGDALYLGGR